MKIKINEREIYLIDLPEEISPQEFLGIFDRLDIIRKLLNKDVFLSISEKKEKKTEYTTFSKARKLSHKSCNKIFWNFIKTNKENYIKFAKAYYSKDKQAWEKLLQEINLGKMRKETGASDNFRKLRTLFNVKPEDVGLKNWLIRGQIPEYVRIE